MGSGKKIGIVIGVILIAIGMANAGADEQQLTSNSITNLLFFIIFDF